MEAATVIAYGVAKHVSMAAVVFDVLERWIYAAVKAGVLLRDKRLAVMACALAATFVDVVATGYGVEETASVYCETLAVKEIAVYHQCPRRHVGKL